ncbi:MAG: GGDEF domain-containing protein [Candidatus Accumulibacter sp.]|uniref:GGDEF domain-containing protein n=1 Tax=Accumulibacter sp. TaxID=2053492 RepID=UPI0019E61522|nr:GGDEF domain-containing protein [Accumulibacter sp.]MBE2258515.1 GGDEF domain-containing protein [Paracoccaceae bacterium]MCB1942034.1 GGDEF domain-containing protein [Accumulibacter sp.]MCP5249945.1 GGDEF domain-containing protein [Accumulibacter sp.]
MFKHDQSPLVRSSRYASRRSARRPALATLPLLDQAHAMAPAANGRGQHTRLRRADMPRPAAAVLQLLAAEARIEKLESELAEARQAAFTDTLTGALNRRGFDEACQRELARARRNGSELAIALIDLDDFKRLNDTMGHQAGDQALVHLVKGLRAALRPSDILCRFGGEEFIVLLPDTALAEAAAAISRFQRQFAATTMAGSNLVITFSAGVVAKDRSESLEESILRADAATYAAKRAGKNCVVTG